MKILLATGIYPPEGGGPATFTRALARFLVSRGHQIEIVTYGDKTTEHGAGFRVHVISRSYGVCVRYMRYTWRVFCLARKADRVFAQGPVSEGFPVFLATFFARKPYVLKIVGDVAWESYQRNGGGLLLDAFLETVPSGKIRLLQCIERFVARRASSLFVPSAYLKSIVQKWGIQQDKIQVIYNAIHPVASDIQADALRASRAIPSEALLLLTNVRAVPWKGVDTLLRALAQTPLTTHFACIGDGPCLPAWKKLATELGLDARVHWLGLVPYPRVMAWLEASDVFVLASGYEGYPHVVAEALQMGVPCLVSDQAGNAEMAELYPELVRTVPYGDVDAWRHAMMSLGRKQEVYPIKTLPSMEQMGERYEKGLASLV